MLMTVMEAHWWANPATQKRVMAIPALVTWLMSGTRVIRRAAKVKVIRLALTSFTPSG